MHRGYKITPKRLAQIWFYANPDEWDALDTYVKKNELWTCGILLRGGYNPSWLNVEGTN